MTRHSKRPAGKKSIARAVKWGVITLIAILVAALLALLFQPGRDLWPLWLLVHRKQIVGILLLAIVLLIFLAPILIEATSNTRTLSGPGKTYSGNRLDEWDDELRR